MRKKPTEPCIKYRVQALEKREQELSKKIDELERVLQIRKVTVDELLEPTCLGCDG